MCNRWHDDYRTRLSGYFEEPFRYVVNLNLHVNLSLMSQMSRLFENILFFLNQSLKTYFKNLHTSYI